MSFNNAQQSANFAAFLQEYGDGVEDGVQAVLEAGADNIVDSAKAACPDNDLDPTPGALRESIHKHPSDRPLSVIIEADAKDKDGDYYGVHVEAGHRSKDGGHVPAHPFFFPVYRLEKPQIKKDLAATMRSAAKQHASGL